MRSTNLGEVFLKLQNWYQGECNGDWEHSFGIKIETLDNPGWLVVIDLEETRWSELKRDLTRSDRSKLDWFQFEFTDSQFKGAGGVGNLAEILEAFFEALAENT